MKHLYLLSFFIGITSFGQATWNDFSGKEKAFLYHQTRRVEVLRAELFDLFEYADSIPYINDTLPDYSYVEKQIVADPSLLTLHTDEIPRQSVGVVMDLSVRYALWELDQILQFRNSTAEEDKPLLEKLKVFEEFVLEEVPPSAVKTLTSGEYVLLKSVSQYYSPSLTVSDKLAAILNSGFNQVDQMLILNAIMRAQEEYVSMRAIEVYTQLGGKNTDSDNFLSAVGDGSNLAEIIGGFNTPYSLGLPDEKGLFRYIIAEKEDEEKKRTNLVVKAIEQKDFVTSSSSATVVHVDVFGYHPERQTTLVIQKGGNSYVLYGKNDQRMVSPDSTYGEGTTYWRLMYTLEHFYIANLKEDLYGKHGYEYQIDLYEKKIEKTRLQIKATEFRLDELRYTPEGKPKIKKKKIKKKDLGTSDQAGRGHPTSALSKLDKKKNIEQNRLIQLNNQLDGQKAILAKLKEDMEKAYENLIKFETKLDYMKKNMGYTIMEYTVDHDFYRFKDGATFNYITQDFTFAPGQSSEAFQIYHISFGKEVFDEKVDENFTRIQVYNAPYESEYMLERAVKMGNNVVFSISDSIQIMELFKHLAAHKSVSELKLVAGGIKAGEAPNLYTDSDQKPIGFDESAYQDERIIHYFAQKDDQLKLTITAYAGQMIPADFETYRAAFSKLKLKHPDLNEIDFYTGIIAKRAADEWFTKLQNLVPIWVKEPADQKAILSQLKKMKPKKVDFLQGSFSSSVPK